jgi:hypothetical protein
LHPIKFEDIILENVEKPEIQRSSCTTCIVRTEEGVVIIENSGAENEGLQNVC